MFHKPSAKQPHIRVPVLALVPAVNSHSAGGTSATGGDTSATATNQQHPLPPHSSQQHSQQRPQQYHSLAVTLFPRLAGVSFPPFGESHDHGGASDAIGGDGCDENDALYYGYVTKASEGLCHHPHLPHSLCLSTTTTTSTQPLSSSLSMSESLSPTLLDEIYVLILGALISMVDDLAARTADQGQALALSTLLDPGNKHIAQYTSFSTIFLAILLPSPTLHCLCQCCFCCEDHWWTKTKEQGLGLGLGLKS